MGVNKQTRLAYVHHTIIEIQEVSLETMRTVLRILQSLLALFECKTMMPHYHVATTLQLFQVYTNCNNCCWIDSQVDCLAVTVICLFVMRFCNLWQSLLYFKWTDYLCCEKELTNHEIPILHESLNHLRIYAGRYVLKHNPAFATCFSFVIIGGVGIFMVKWYPSLIALVQTNNFFSSGVRGDRPDNNTLGTNKYSHSKTMYIV